MIQLNADSLKGSLGRMTACGSHLGGNGCLYDLAQLSCSGNRLFLPCLYDMLCNVFGKAVFSVITDNAEQLHLAVSITISAAVSSFL